MRTGKVRSSISSFWTATGCPQNQQTFNTQQVAAYAAGKQRLFWDYTELFYHEQGQEDTGYVNTSYLDGLARQIPKLEPQQVEVRSGRPDSAIAGRGRSSSPPPPKAEWHADADHDG